MGAPPARLAAPTLVVIRSNGEPVDRTARAVEAALGRADRVVVARPSGTAAPVPTAALRRLRAERHEECDLAAIVREHAALGGACVVLSDGAYGVDKRWLSDLAAAAVATDAAVVAATNAAPWPSCPVDLPDARANRNEWRDFGRSLQGCPTAPVTDPSEIAGPVVALGPAAVAALWTQHGAVPADLTPAALAGAAATAGVVVHRADGAYVHDARAVVLLSACLIVKDESENLARCLSSLLPVVDEIVVYDTGSTDGSIDLARSLGAIVVEGTWDDDFSKARNAARAHCRGTWLLHIDADEEIEDPLSARDLRSVLDRDVPVDILALPLHNMMGTELAPVRAANPHSVPRILHRARCSWTGALHEHPTPVSGATPRAVRAPAGISLVHYGYLDEVMARRGKAGRNAHIAEHKLDDVAEAGRTHFDRARTHVMNDRLADAIEEYGAAADDRSASPVHRRCALEQAATVLLNIGRPREADDWITRREAIPAMPGVGRWLRARQAIDLGEHERALELLDGIHDYTDNFSTNGPDGVHLMRAQAQLGLGEHAAAAAELVAAAECNPMYDQAWSVLIRHAERWPDAITAAARLLPSQHLKLLAARLLSAPTNASAVVAEATWAAHPGAPALLALAIELAPRLELEDAARWAVRLRAAGQQRHCPLTAIAANEQAPLVLRLQAAYLGAELFGDDHLATLQQDLAALLPTA